MSLLRFVILLFLLSIPTTLSTRPTQSQQVRPESEAEKQEIAGKIKLEFLHAWRGYKQYAWAHDDLRPLVRRSQDMQL